MSLLAPGMPLTCCCCCPATEGGDSFRTPGQLGYPWRDAYDTWPDLFIPARVQDGTLYVSGVREGVDLVENCFGVTPETPANSSLAHVLAARPIGRTDNVEVTVWIRCPEDFLLISQVQPAAYVDFDAPDPLRMGIAATTDISLPGQYVQNVFRFGPLCDVFDPSRYIAVVGTTGYWDYTSWVNGTVKKFSLRVSGGFCSFYIDDVVQCAPSAIPPWVNQNVDSWGFQIIPISAWSYPRPTEILDWTWRDIEPGELT